MRGLLSWVDFGVGFVCSSVLASPYMSYSVDISWLSSVSLMSVVVVSAICAVATTSTAFSCVASYCSGVFSPLVV